MSSNPTQHELTTANRDRYVSPDDCPRVLKARTSVPARPHPLAPQTGGGMQGKVLDKVVETVTDRDFVDVKYAHPEA